MKIIARAYLIAWFILLFPCSVWAAPLADCAQATVQTAVTAAASGATIELPACESTSWATPVTWTGKTLTIEGQGATTVIASAGANALFTPTLTSDYTATIGNMTIDGTAGGATFGLIQIAGGTTASRVHDITFNGLSTRAVGILNASTGSVDKNVFNYGSGSGQAVSLFGNGTLDATAWTGTDNLGGSNFVFIENNIFNWNRSGDSVLDAYGGARFVFRYNKVVDSNIGWHGLDSGGYFSPRAFEVYNNEFLMNSAGTKYFAAIYARGGTGVVHDNTFGGTVGYSYGFRVVNYRTGNTYQFWQTCDGTEWKACANLTGGYISACTSNATCEAITAGTTCSWYWNEGRTAVGAQDATYNYYLDINDSAGYPCANQVGRGQNNTLSPVYQWNNLLDGVASTIKSDSASIAADRDYYDNTEKPDYTAYTCPHPLADPGATGYCNPAVAGTTGYNLEAGGDPVPYAVTPSVTSGSGTISPNVAEAVSAGGNSSTYTATPANGWKVTWSGTCGATGTGATYQKTNVTEDCTVIATFTEIKLMPW